MCRENDNRSLTYRIDANDCLISVDKNWLAFARENQAPHLTSDWVLHKPLWDFITDSETQLLYQMMLAQVRRKGTSIRFPFRCDSADCRRYLEMEIAAIEERLIEFRTHIIRQESRNSVSLLDANIDRTEEYLTICGWCKKVEVSASRWVEVENAVEELDLFGAPRLPDLTHGICQTCSERYRQELADTGR